MILFKCKCGCAFTVKDTFLKGKGYKSILCQNCGVSFRACGEDDLDRLYSHLDNTGFSVRVPPDDAQIDIRFPL